MSAPARLVAFALVLAALFAAAFLIGRAVDPDVGATGGEHEAASAIGTAPLTPTTEAFHG